jgi:catechol 2,3-dioxygenase-like lactoylglutathione lyase family enzyme
MRLKSAMIYVRDLPRMRAFYGQMLEAKPVNSEWTDRYALFDAGGADFALHAIPGETAGRPETASPPRPRETSPVKLTFAVDDVRAERARLEGMGVAIIQRPWQEPDQACDGVDPEGNIFQITAVV